MPEITGSDFESWALDHDAVWAKQWHRIMVFTAMLACAVDSFRRGADQ